MTALFNSRFLLSAVFGVVLIGAGWSLCLHHPLGGMIASVFFISLFAVGLANYSYWLVIIPAALPIVDLAPWSGWLTFEEFDLLVLALASGSYFRLAFMNSDWPSRGSEKPISLFSALLIAGFTVSVIVSMFRGFDDAGGFSFGWYQGYLEPMNSIRLVKNFFLALCLIPLWFRVNHNVQEKAVNFLTVGIALGLGFASLATIWERIAFTGLLNFSTDYRTTALFWEMHVGGAALDGYLALSVPFAVWAFLRARSPRGLIIFGIILAMAMYACLTTFSRGVYLALPIGLAVMAGLSLRNGGLQRIRSRELGLAPLLLLVGGFAAGVVWIFPTSGYRGMLALCSAVALFYPVNQVWGRMAPNDAWLSVALGTVAVLVGVLGAYFLPKGAYVVFVLGTLLTALALWMVRCGISSAISTIIIAAYWMVLAACVAIAWHWGGEAAIGNMAVICLLLLVSGLLIRLRPLPERGIRWHVGLLGMLLLIGFSIATFTGGRYMSERFSTTTKDMSTRLHHWEAGLAQLNTSDWLFGKGLGRYPATYFYSATGGEHPGGYRLVESDEGGQLLISGGQHVLGWGELYRVSQRVSPGSTPYTVAFEVIAEKNLTMHFEVCEKHLLYNNACATGQINVKGQADQWQKLQLKLQGGNPDRGLWYAPNIVVFSVAMQSTGELAHIDNLVLLDGFGDSLLLNGDFSRGMAHWFSSSDRHHMPWHIKSLFLNILFDQGGLGLALFFLMIAGVAWRLTVGSAHGHQLAPVLMGSLAGFLVVGLFDSLLDAPRVATLFYLLLLVGLVVNVRQESRPAMAESPRHRDAIAKGI